MTLLVRLKIFGLLFFISGLVSAAPPTTSQWIAVDDFSDEFNGPDLDATKWYPLNPRWSGRPPSRFARENVRIRDGSLVIQGTTATGDTALAREGIEFKTGTIKSQRPIRYGYFEISSRIAKSRISSAFWLYDHSNVTWTEIDVFELCGVPPCADLYRTNAHARIRNSGTGKNEQFSFPASIPMPAPVANGVFKAALEWDKDFIRWYVDGKMIREIKNLHWHDPLFIVLDSEVFLEWFGRPDPGELPSEFTIDYLRVWQRVQ